MFRDVVKLIAPRMTPGSTQAARAALARAWTVRANPGQFPREDFAVIRAVVEDAGFLPAVWMINRMAGVYLEIAETVSAQFKIPDDYLDSYSRMFDALDRNDGETAAGIIAEYLDRHDTGLTRALEVFA